jgi:hypothetical protein
MLGDPWTWRPPEAQSSRLTQNGYSPMGHLLDHPPHDREGADAPLAHDHGHHHRTTGWARVRHTLSEAIGGHSHDSAEQIDDALGSRSGRAQGTSHQLGCARGDRRTAGRRGGDVGIGRRERYGTESLLARGTKPEERVSSLPSRGRRHVGPTEVPTEVAPVGTAPHQGRGRVVPLLSRRWPATDSFP